MVYTLCLVNEKGGVGKTTLAATLAAGLAIRDYRVLLIDADPQGHATLSLKVKEQPGLHQLLVGDAEWQSVLASPMWKHWRGRYITTGDLFVLPGNIETRLIAQQVSDMARLRNRLDDLGSYVDVAIIDTSPTPTLLHTLLYYAADALILPTTCDSLALDGIGKTVVHSKGMARLRNESGIVPAKLIGVQPTIFNPRLNAHREGLRTLDKHFGEYVWPAIVERTVWRDAGYRRQSIFAYVGEHPAIDEAWGFVDQVSKHIPSKEAFR